MRYRPLRGFSLIEVTVAVAIIGTMIVATGILLQRIPINGREVRDQDLALKIAHNEVEILRASGYASLPANGPFANALLSSLASSTSSVTITDFNAKTKQVDVSVYWKGVGLVTRSVSLTTLITQNSGLP
jgi:prepilin-type N-terminal cleavage/methylation domain-containing protein